MLNSKKQKPKNSNNVLALWLQTGQHHIHLEIKLENLGIIGTVYHRIYLRYTKRYARGAGSEFISLRGGGGTRL